MSLNKLLGYSLSFTHCLLAILAIYITIFSTNMNTVLFMVFYWFMILFLWYILGNCFITYFENKLLGEPNDTTFWFVLKAKRYNKVLGDVILKCIIFQPVIWCIVALFRIKYLCKNK